MLIKGINGRQLDFGRVKMEAGFFERATVVPCFSLSLSFTHTRTHTHTPTHAHGGNVEVPAPYLKIERISVILSGEHDTCPVRLADTGD